MKLLQEAGQHGEIENMERVRRAKKGEARAEMIRFIRLQGGNVCTLILKIYGKRKGRGKKYFIFNGDLPPSKGI